MGVMLAAAGRGLPARSVGLVAGGLAVWLCGVVAVALTAAMILELARAGSQELRTIALASNLGAIRSLEWSALFVALALPIAAVASFLAGVAAAEPAIGGAIGKLSNVALRFGPGVPSVAIGAAALATVDSNASIKAVAFSHPLASAVIVLAALNLPVMTARFRTVLRAVPKTWKAAATAAGATSESAFFRIVLPRAWPGIVAAMLNGFGQMLGETAALAIILSSLSGPIPLSVDLWRRLVSPSAESPAAIPAAASETLLLVAIIVALRFGARVLLRRRRAPGGLA